METPVQGRPNRETGLPPGVEVGPLGKRFVAYLINISIPVIVGLALVFLLPTTTGALGLALGMIGALIAIGWLVVVWYTLAVRAASPGLRAMKLQLVGFLDGRPIGPARVFLRALLFWALFITGIGLLIMLIMMLRHPRKQGWHDLAVTAVMIKERLLAPPVQPARAATYAQQGSPAQLGNSQPQPSGVRAAAAPSYAPGQGYAPAASPVPPGPTPGMAPASSGAPYAAAVPPGLAAPYGGNAYPTPSPGARHMERRHTGHRPLRSHPAVNSIHLCSRPVRCHRCRRVLLPTHRLGTRTCRSMQFHPVISKIRTLADTVLPTSRIGRSCWTTGGGSWSRDSSCSGATRNPGPAKRTRN